MNQSPLRYFSSDAVYDWNGEAWDIVAPNDRALAQGIKRIWFSESPPYPAQVRTGDLWYYGSENRLYIRKQEYWVQIV